MRRISWLLLSALGGISGFKLDRGEQYEAFITRPDLKAPRMMVAKHDPKSISKGFWFLSAYKDLYSAQPSGLPCQTGAHIYDGNGGLIWSGACLFDNRDVFVFRPVDINGVQHLSGHISGMDPLSDYVPTVFLMNNSYGVVSNFSAEWLDIHDVEFGANGKTAVATTGWSETRPALEINQESRSIRNGGFAEIDIHTGEKIFDWDPLKNGCTLDESFDRIGAIADSGEEWDWFHVNTVAKVGKDYLVASRNTQSAFRVSGKDGHVMWRLGGDRSDFKMDKDAMFSWQHDVRIRFENKTHTIVSLFDNNERWEDRRASEISEHLPSAKFLVLDHSSKPMRARLLRKIQRGDQAQTPKLGNVQVLGDDVTTANVFVNWAFEGRIAEYDGNGLLVMEAKLVDDEMRFYRAYKSEFIGHPTEPIAFKILPIAFDATKTVATAFYVSWNGATEVAQWSIYGSSTADGQFKLLTEIERSGFETSWVTSKLVSHAYVEALDADGDVLGRSETASIPSRANGHDLKIYMPLLDDFKPSQAQHASSAKTAPDDSSESAPLFGHWDSGRIDVATALVGGFALYGLLNLAKHVFQFVGLRRSGRFWGKRRGSYRAVPMDHVSP